jgi:hypothetical protein
VLLAPALHDRFKPGAGGCQDHCSSSTPAARSAPLVLINKWQHSCRRQTAQGECLGLAASAPTCVQRQAPVLPHGRGCIVRPGRAPAERHGALPGGLLGIQGHPYDYIDVSQCSPCPPSA